MYKKHIDNADDFREWCKSNWKPVMGFDTETTDLKYINLNIEGFSLYNGEKSIYVTDMSEETFEIFRTYSFGSTLIMHNAVFDMKVIYKEMGIKDGFKPICTLTGAHLVDLNRHLNKLSLKVLAKDWLLIPEEIKTYEEVADLDNTDPKFIEYACNDAIWTYELWRIIENKLKNTGQEYLFHQVEIPFLFVLRDMEINGVEVDPEELVKIQWEGKEKVEELSSKIYKMILEKQNKIMLEQNDPLLFGKNLCVDFNNPPYNLNSSQQMAKIAEELFGLEILEVTKKQKKKSLSAATYLRLKGDPFIDLLAKHAAYKHLWTSFLKPADTHIDKDGRMRPSYGFTVSGRLSCARPNLEQLPNKKKKKTDINFRKIYRAKEGHKLICADWAGQELRVLAHITEDSNMIKAFVNNYDLHLFTANSIFDLGLGKEHFINKTEGHIWAKEKYELERDCGKNGANFPIVYGTTEYGISKRQGVSLEEAARWMKEFFRLYPQVKYSIDKTRQQLYNYGYVCTLMGRRRDFPYFEKANKFRKDGMVREAFNHKIQGLSADMMKIASSMIQKAGLDIILIVHDEIVVECPEEQVEEAIKIMEHAMTKCISLKVPIEVDIAIISNYGE